MSLAARVMHESVLSLPVHLRAVKRQVRHARRVMDDAAPHVLVLAEDTVEYATAALIAAARSRGVPSLIVPFTVPNPREPAETYAHAPTHRLRGLANRLLAVRRREWVREHEGRLLVRLPGGRALALEAAGLAPPRPWALNSGQADAIAVESEAMRDLYAAQGLPPERLRVTGSLADDALAVAAGDRDARRGELVARLALPPHRRLILTALPPNQLGSRAAMCAFGSYEALVTVWMEALTAPPDVAVLVRPHPRETLTPPLSGHPRVRLVTEDTAALIPLADVYVASVSATIRWAIAAGRPTVDYDVYRYRYGDYAGLAGVVTTEDQAEFARAVARLATDDDAWQEAARAQAEAAPRWGRLDGRSGARIVDVLDELTEGSR